jgi:hypothetical protein
VKSIKANLSLLKEKISKLETLRSTKKDAYDKYCEECSKSKEIRDNQIKILKEQISYEQNLKETQIDNANEQGMADEKQLEINHEELMKKLKKDYEDADKKFKALLKTNTDAENLLRKDFKKVSSAYTENMK